MFTLENYQALVMLGALRAHVDAILSSSLEWDDRYRLVFSSQVSEPLLRLVRSSDPSFSWYDPDADYEDDVRAFIRAIDEHIDRERKRLHALSAEQAYAIFHAVHPAVPGPSA